MLSTLLNRMIVLAASCLALVNGPTAGAQDNRPAPPHEVVARYQANACSCPFQGDFDGNGGIDIDDFVAMQNLMIGGGTDVTDANCPTSRGDYNADGFVDVVDMYELFDEYLGGGNPPADPCVCGFPCELPHALGTAGVVVESKSMAPNTTDTIGIRVSNTSNIYG
ncbi:MAG: hypothetical protein GF341_02145, partial [candidate division Zixibacteria bacterium]|nr:hypothetical protein [candidate division Zixibacteria bacterium]